MLKRAVEKKHEPGSTAWSTSGHLRGLKSERVVIKAIFPDKVNQYRLLRTDISTIYNKLALIPQYRWLKWSDLTTSSDKNGHMSDAASCLTHYISNKTINLITYIYFYISCMMGKYPQGICIFHMVFDEFDTWRHPWNQLGTTVLFISINHHTFCSCILGFAIAALNSSPNIVFGKKQALLYLVLVLVLRLCMSCGTCSFSSCGRC